MRLMNNLGLNHAVLRIVGVLMTCLFMGIGVGMAQESLVVTGLISHASTKEPFANIQVVIEGGIQRPPLPRATKGFTPLN